MSRHDEIREKALKDLQEHEVLMLNGHFDFGNGYHGPVYLNPASVVPASVDHLALCAGPARRAAGVGARRHRGRGRTGRPAARCWRTRWPDCSTAAARSRVRRRCSRRSASTPTAATASAASTSSRFPAGRCCWWTMCGIPGRRWRDARASCAKPAAPSSRRREIYDRMEAVADAGVAELRACRVQGARQLRRRHVSSV